MKRCIYTLILLIGLYGLAFADSKVTALGEITDIKGTDVFYIVDDPGGTPASKKITATNVFDLIDTSAELAAILGDETGSTKVVFSASPTLTGTAVVAGIDGSGTISANLFTPDAADGADIGSAALEFSDIYLADGSIIYGQNNQGSTITSGASGWTLSGTTLLTNIDASGTLDFQATEAAGANETHILKQTYQAGDTYTGTQSTLTIKGYDADDTVVHSGNEFTGLAVFVKQEAAMTNGGKSSLATFHHHSSSDVATDFGLRIFGDQNEEAIQVTGGTCDIGISFENQVVTTAEIEGQNNEILSNADDGFWDIGAGEIKNDDGTYYNTGDENTIAAAITTGLDATDIDSNISNTEYGYLNGLSGNIQDQLDAGSAGRFTQGMTAVAFTGSDATPDVNNNTTDVHQLWQTADTTTITDLDDGTADVGGDTTANHSSFSDGDTLVIQCLHAAVFDLSDNANLKGHGNNDYTCAAGEFVLAIFDDTNDYWVLKPSETKTANFSTFELPNGTDDDINGEAELSYDTDGANETVDESIRGFDGANQWLVSRKLKCYNWTVVSPNDLADGTRDACPVWSNESGMTFTITKVESWSDTDDTEYNLEEEDGDGANNATITAVDVDTNGTGLYYDTVTSMTGTATVEANHIILVDFDDTDDPGWVKGTFCGWYNADVD